MPFVSLNVTIHLLNITKHVISVTLSHFAVSEGHIRAYSRITNSLNNVTRTMVEPISIIQLEHRIPYHEKYKSKIPNAPINRTQGQTLNRKCSSYRQLTYSKSMLYDKARDNVIPSVLQLVTNLLLTSSSAGNDDKRGIHMGSFFQ